MNALLHATQGLPSFDQFAPAQIKQAIDELIAKAQAAIDQATAADTPISWQDVVALPQTATESLGRAWGMVSHLNAVADTPELREQYNLYLPVVTEFWTQLGQNEALYAKYKALKASTVWQTLSATQQRVIENALRDFRLGGAELSEQDKPVFAHNQQEQAAAAQAFSEHVLDATDQFSLTVTAQELDGVPPQVLAATLIDGKGAHALSLKMPVYLPVMQYCTNRNVREQLYKAYSTRASELGAKPEHDNSALIKQLLQLREQEANLLGFDTSAQVSLQTKMADSPEQVLEFLQDLSRKAKPYAEQDMQELRAFAAEHLNLPDLRPWDIPFASEKLREERYAFSDQELKAYFPLPKVLDGLFGVIQTLFEVRIRPDSAPVWHPDVQFFRIDNAQGELIGQFYLDLYARNGKRSGAWMDDCRGRMRNSLSGAVQTPVAYLVCNFTPPSTLNGISQSPTLTHDEVITLFHEFGHGLHHMLTRVDELSVSGINAVEWDAVELPSQFMENFCWDWQVLQSMTAHETTGQPLPRTLYEKMLAAKNFQAGMQFVRQLEFGMTDMLLHHRFNPATDDFMQTLAQVRTQVAVVERPAYDRMLHSFSHIFAGGYSAGYYSYKWAEVLSADAFAAFEEAAIQVSTPAQPASVLQAEPGRRFLREVLSVGGSRSAMDSFKAFRGRAPTIDALLRHNGMMQVSA